MIFIFTNRENVENFPFPVSEKVEDFHFPYRVKKSIIIEIFTVRENPIYYVYRFFPFPDGQGGSSRATAYARRLLPLILTKQFFLRKENVI